MRLSIQIYYETTEAKFPIGRQINAFAAIAQPFAAHKHEFNKI
jgi:hypothetical protein